MEFSPGILGGEAPVDDRTGHIALLFQGFDLPAKGLFVGEPLPETTAGDDTELDFRHIQPAAMLGRVVKLQLPGYVPGLLRREC